MAGISELRPSSSVLDVVWDDGVVTTYPWLWLRDHSHDPETLHPVSMQRLLFTAGVPADIRGERAAVEGDDLVVDWDGGGRSRLPVAFLADFRTTAAVPTRVEVEPVLWDSTTIYPTPSVPYDEIMASDEGTIRWLTEVAKYGFAFATGTPATREATEGLVRRVAYVRESIFGGFWEFTADLKHADLAYTNTELLAHSGPRTPCQAAASGATHRTSSRVPGPPSPSTRWAATPRWSTASASPRSSRRRRRSSSSCCRRSRSPRSTSATARTSCRPARPCATTTPAGSCRCRSTTATARRSCCRPTR